MDRQNSRDNLLIWLGIVLFLSITVRVLLFTTYPPRTFGDTGGYFRSAQAVLNGFENYDGTRTPVYPTYIALLGSERAIYAGQLLLGVCISIAWFFIGYKISSRPVFGALIALAHSLNPGQFFFEANLLTETLATFFLTLSLLGAYIWLSNAKHRSIWLGLGIGLSAALAALTRPQFIFMPFLITVFLAFSFHDRRIHFNWKPVIGVLLPAAVIIGGWMGWIHSRYHMFSLTTMTGFHLVQHTGYYFEDVPDEYAALRDVYLEYRDNRIEAYGTQSNTIWDAIPAMQQAAGMNFYELSRELQGISVQLILRNPRQYLQKVVIGWFYFWRSPVYWDRSAFTSQAVTGLMQIWVFGARGLMVLMNIAFVLSSLGALVFDRLRRFWKLSPFHWLLAGCIWGTSILTSLVEHGENQRFLIPLQTAVIFWGLWLAFVMINKKIESGRKPAKI